MSTKHSSKQFPTLKMRRVASSSLRYDVDVNDLEDVHAETDGKTPIEAALIVMRKITRAAGADTVTRGISSLDKLQSLPTEAALKLLGKTDWRKFFDDEEKFVRDQRCDAAKFSNKHQDHSHKHTHLHLKAKMNEYFEEMVTRVDTLWKLVKIPHRDMEFYRGTLIKGPPKSLEHCRELANYIKMLHLNRLSVLSVLKTIDARESALANLHDVLASIARQRTLLPSRSGRAISGPGDRPPSKSPHSVPNSQFPSHSHHSDRNDNSNSNSNSNSHGKGREGSRSEFWLLQLVIALSDLQVATFAVVRAVQHWRRDLWRPQPFIWQHVNYLLKMKSDEASYDTLMLRQMLDQVPLSPSELPCVLMGIASDPCMPHQASAFSFDTHHGATTNSNEPPSGLRLKFFASQPADVSLEDMQRAAGRVNDEAELQKYVRKERLLLKKRHAFIPALRPRPKPTPGPDQYHFHDDDHDHGSARPEDAMPFDHEQEQVQKQFVPSGGAQHQEQQQDHFPLQTDSFHWEWRGEAGWDGEGGEGMGMGVGVGAIVPPHLIDGAPHNEDDLMSAPGVQSYVFDDPPLGPDEAPEGGGTVRVGCGSVKSHQSQSHRHRTGKNTTTSTNGSSSRDGADARRGGQGGGGGSRAGLSSAGSVSISGSQEGRQGARPKLEPLGVGSGSRGEGLGVPNNSTQLTVGSSSSKKYSSHAESSASGVSAPGSHAESSASGVSAPGSKSRVGQQQKHHKQGKGRGEANELSDGQSLSLYSADFHHSTSLSDHAARGGHHHPYQHNPSVGDSKGDEGDEGYDVDFEAADDGSAEGPGGYKDKDEDGEGGEGVAMGGVGNYDDDDFEAMHSSHHVGGYDEDDFDEHEHLFDAGSASFPSPSPHHRSYMGSSGEIDEDIE